MPNGRFGAIYVACDALLACFRSIDGDPVVGTMDKEVTRSQVEAMLESDVADSLFVEGQRHERRSFFVVHFDWSRWLWVPESSPVHPALFRVWMEAHEG